MTEPKKDDIVKKTFQETQEERKDKEQKEQKEQTNEQGQQQEQKKELQYSDDFIEYFSNLVKDYENITSKTMETRQQNKDDMYINMFDYIEDEQNKGDKDNDGWKIDDSLDNRINNFNDFRDMVINAILSSKKGEEKDKQKLEQDKQKIISEIADLISRGSTSDDYIQKTEKIMTDLEKILDPVEVNGKTYNIAKIFKGNMDNYLSKDTRPIALNNNIKPSSMIFTATRDLLQKKHNISRKEAETIENFLQETVNMTHENLKTITTEKKIAKAEKIVEGVRKSDNTKSDPDVKKFEKGVKEELKELFFEPLIQMFSFLTCMLPFDDAKKAITKEIGKIGEKIIDIPFSSKEKFVDNMIKKGKEGTAEAKTANENFKKKLEESFKKTNPKLANYLDELKTKASDYSKMIDMPANLDKGTYEDENIIRATIDEDTKTIKANSTGTEKLQKNKTHTEKEEERREQKKTNVVNIEGVNYVMDGSGRIIRAVSDLPEGLTRER